MPELKEPLVLRPGAAPAERSDACSPRARHARAIPARCSTRPRPSSAPARRRRPTCARARRASGSPRCSRRRKIVAILREPASFLRSLHLQLRQNHVENEKDLGKAIALEAARREGGSCHRARTSPQALLYSDHVRYVEQLRRYRDAFGARADAGADLRRLPHDNEATVRQVLRFLDVEDDVEPHVREANPTVRAALAAARRARCARSRSGGGPVARAVKSAIEGAAAPPRAPGGARARLAARSSTPSPPRPTSG